MSVQTTRERVELGYATLSDSELIFEEADDLLEMEGGINRDLLLRVVDYIQEHPEQFDMHTWLTLQTERQSWLMGLFREPNTTLHCCIAGCAVLLAKECEPERVLGENVCKQDLFREAAALLNLTRSQAEKLFYECNWPPSYQLRIGDLTPGSVEYANVAVARIKQFVGNNNHNKFITA